jgi:hypothetical protein
MEKYLEFMRKKHEHLQDNYNPELGKTPDDCTDIALHLARLLINAGKLPKIIRFSRGGKILHPVIFDRKSELVYHDVCLSEGIVYDPVLKQPTDLEDYQQRFFGERLPFRTLISEKEIERKASQ